MPICRLSCYDRIAGSRERVLVEFGGSTVGDEVGRKFIHAMALPVLIPGLSVAGCSFA